MTKLTYSIWKSDLFLFLIKFNIMDYMHFVKSSSIIEL